MAGQLDSLLKSVAKDIVATLGDSLDTTITYVKKGVSSYNVETGEQVTVDTTYSDIKVPIEFIKSEDDEGREIRQAKLYITPDLIGDNQVDFDDEIQLTYAGETRTAQIYDIDTRRGGQVYLFTILVRF
jgi:ribosomal 50S subunit-recycling heat shock protein|tara:strand:- start:592 stop:978 length:387 start_codon:yes stop_codon:yes gene_type:complete